MEQAADILLTGATGFIGSHVAERLAAAGRRVRCLVRPTSDRSVLPARGVELVEGDLGDRAGLEAALAGAGAVVHLAAVLRARSEREFFRVNTWGMRNLIEAARGLPGRFVYVSSQSAAGPSCGREPIDEERPPAPVSAYGRSKLRGERALLESGLAPVILRPGIVYGPRERDLLMVFRAARRRLLPLVGWRDGLANAVFVADLVEAVILALEAPGAAGRTYFINDGEVYTWSGLARQIAAAVGRRALRLRLPLGCVECAVATAGRWSRRASILGRDKLRELRARYWVASAARARRELGFRPQVPLAEGLRRTAEWYRQAGWL